MGSVLGVAISSLVLQNALLIFLEQKVIGPDKKDVSLHTPYPALHNLVTSLCEIAAE
jgi:hypothetical protein